MANEVVEQKPKQSFSLALTDELNNVKQYLPKNFNVARFVQNAIAVLNENEQLSKYAQQYGSTPIKAGLLKGAYLGLDFYNKECYLIPYGKDLQFMIDYRGNVKLAKMYSIRPIKDIYVKLVKDGDEFSEEIIAGQPTINFKPKPFNNGKVVGAFAVCLFKDGGMLYDTMSLEELETVRSCSKMKNGVTWTKFTNQMYKKCMLHRLCKQIELEMDNPSQLNYMYEDIGFSADPYEQAKSEIESNANSQEFIEG